MDEKKRKEIEHDLRTDMLINAIKNDPGFHEVAFALLETFKSCEDITVDDIKKVKNTEWVDIEDLLNFDEEEEKQYNEFISNKNYRMVINTDKKFDDKSEVSIHAKKRIDDIVKEYNIKFHPKLHHRTKKKDL